MKNRLIVNSGVVVFCAVVVAAGCSPKKTSADEEPQGSVKSIFANRAIEQEGERLYKAGLYQEAIQKFEEADQPQYRLYSYSINGYARSYIQEIYWATGDFDAALKDVEVMYIKRPDLERLEEKRSMYKALIQWRDTSDPAPVHQFIQELKEKNAKILPPAGHDFITPGIIATIVRLYDTIGDYDSGIQLIDTFLDSAYQNNPTVKRVKDSEEALQLSKLRHTREDRINRRSYEVLREYLLVREALTQDKVEGKHGAEPGKPGRATQAIIVSKYFPG